MKQNIVNFLRKAGLIFIIDYARYAVIRIKNKNRNEQFLKNHPDESFPPHYMIYETFRLDYERFYISGEGTAQWIVDEISRFKKIEHYTILDWGCGPGRVCRHLPKLLPANVAIHACDYNEDYVNWCSSNIKNVSFKKNQLDPPLPYNDEQMDIVYGLSIFTHLSEIKHTEWVDELLRVLKPGGILFITTHGNITRENLTVKEKELFEEGQLVVRANVKEGHRMYVAYQPETFMHSLFSGKAKILLHTPGTKQSWGLQQDLWIVEK